MGMTAIELLLLTSLCVAAPLFNITLHTTEIANEDTEEDTVAKDNTKVDLEVHYHENMTELDANREGKFRITFGDVEVLNSPFDVTFGKVKVTNTQGGWSGWSEFGPCSATCGAASKRRERTCYGGTVCPGLNHEIVPCTLSACPYKSPEEKKLDQINENLNAIGEVTKALQYIMDGITALSSGRKKRSGDEQSTDETKLLDLVDQVTNLVEKCALNHDFDNCDSKKVKDITQKMTSTFDKIKETKTVSSVFQNSFGEKKTKLDTAILAAENTQKDEKAKTIKAFALAVAEGTSQETTSLEVRINEINENLYAIGGVRGTLQFIMRRITEMLSGNIYDRKKRSGDEQSSDETKLLDLVDQVTNFVEMCVLNHEVDNCDSKKIKDITQKINSAFDKIYEAKTVSSVFYNSFGEKKAKLDTTISAAEKNQEDERAKAVKALTLALAVAEGESEERINEINKNLNTIGEVSKALQYIMDGITELLSDQKKKSDEQSRDETKLLDLIYNVANLVEKCDLNFEVDSCDSNQLKDITQKMTTTFDKIKETKIVSSVFQNSFGAKLDSRSMSRFVTNTQGGWSGWSEFGPCSATCGAATKRRDRTCYGGTVCPGLDHESVQCTLSACPYKSPEENTQGGWSGWTEFGPCSATCGAATKRRARTCYGGTVCPGLHHESVQCTLSACPYKSPEEKKLNQINENLK